jgi:hypothetical protein
MRYKGRKYGFLGKSSGKVGFPGFLQGILIKDKIHKEIQISTSLKSNWTMNG